MGCLEAKTGTSDLRCGGGFAGRDDGGAVSDCVWKHTLCSFNITVSRTSLLSSNLIQ